jgi:Ca2+-binding EF-hand superfamily protein
MAASVIEAKSRSVFELFDTDQDGLITQDDFIKRANQVIGQFPDGPSVKSVLDQYTRAWRELAAAADTDQDGQVTRQEFAQVLATADPQGVARAIGGSMAEFSLADGDGDGYVDGTEFARLLRGYDVSPSEASTIFGQLDTDGDGRISRQEYWDAMEEFFAGDDPGSPIVALYARLSGS